MKYTAEIYEPSCDGFGQAVIEMVCLLKSGGLDRRFGLKSFDLERRYVTGFGAGSVLVLLSAGDVVVGGCVIFPRLQRSNGPCALLADLYVEPEHRNYACIFAAYRELAAWRAGHDNVPFYTLPNTRATRLNQRFLGLENIDFCFLEVRIRPVESRTIAELPSDNVRNKWYRNPVVITSDDVGRQVVWRGVGIPFVKFVLTADEGATCAPSGVVLATAKTHERMAGISVPMGRRRLVVQCNGAIKALFPQGLQLDDFDIL
ncbi:hypothetical protein R2A130_1225 [Ahrensia sp. R2A130]|nr:hypothetical protein R2A130_1225 [Ahrensia sp. R2A130]